MISIARTFGARNRAGGQADLQGVEGAAAGGEVAADVRRDVHHVTVMLDRHHVADLHRAEIGDAADVVAAQIDQHHVLGPLLRIGQQLLGQAAVFLVRLAPRRAPAKGRVRTRKTAAWPRSCWPIRRSGPST